MVNYYNLFYHTMYSTIKESRDIPTVTSKSYKIGSLASTPNESVS